MARLWSCGFELQSTTAGVEYDSSWGSPTIDTTIKRSGAASLKLDITGTNEAGFNHRVSSAGGVGYLRFYLYIETMPDVDCFLSGFRDSSVGADQSYLVLTSSGTLQLWGLDNVSPPNGYIQIGSDSGTLSTGQWYMVEMYQSTSTTTWYYTAKLDGSTFANGSKSLGGTSLTNTVDFDFYGFNSSTNSTQSVTAATVYIDDVAFNDNTGSYQNSYPGEGSIVHMHPDSAGDNNPTAGDYTNINETTPDDASGYIQLDANGDIGDFNLESSSSAGIGSGDTITLVQVGVRDRAETAATESWALRIKGQATGTTTESATTTHNDITWRTNGDTNVYGYRLTSYVNPQDSAAWEPSDLDSAQIGIRAVDASPDIWVTTLWALVEYVPAQVSGTNMQLNIGDTWKNVSAIKINIGDSWKNVIHAKVNIGDTWKEIF